MRVHKIEAFIHTHAKNIGIRDHRMPIDIAELLGAWNLAHNCYMGPAGAPDEKHERQANAGQNAGITLTESFAMLPTSAVSGYYFAHPDAQYFGVARIGRDQLEDYARRRGVSIEQAEKWLRPNIGY